MSSYLLLICCLAFGWAMARYWPMPENTAPALNAWIMRIALPALVLAQIPKLEPAADLILPALAMWWVMLGAFVLMPLIGRRLAWTRSTVGCMILLCGLGNTSFIGLPMLQALRGHEALGAAVIADQLGSFLALSTFGVVIAAIYGGSRADAAEIVRRIVRFPPFLALPIAFVALGLGGWPTALDEVLQRLGGTLTPVALFVVGMQFRVGDVRHHLREIGIGLSWKMLLAPLGVAAFALATGQQGLAAKVGILQAAMAPMVTAGILAQQSGLAPRLANTILSVGTLLSLVSVPLWSLLIG